MTVAQIREEENTEHSEVTFLESARYYRLLKADPQYGERLERLRTAWRARAAVDIWLGSLDSDIIEDVQPLPPRE